jgi:hypothetical protein
MDDLLGGIMDGLKTNEPRQTRPNDAKWCNNQVQWRPKGSTVWRFWDELTEDGIFKETWEFKDGRIKVKELRLDHPQSEFRLVAILEVT